MAKLAPSMALNIVSTISFFLFCFLPTVFSDSSVQNLYPPGFGPDSSAFDSAGDGPYITVADGRILKYIAQNNSFVTYAYTSKTRVAILCDGTNSTNLIQICGRGLGLGFYFKTGELYVVDLLGGLMVVGPGGGVARQIAAGTGGLPFTLLDALEVDQKTGTVYFTNLSGKYNISQLVEMILKGDATGKLLKYDPNTRAVTVLLDGLGGPAGVAISDDGSYLLVTELLKNRVLKYWLTGPKSNKAEVLMNLSGSPDNVKRNPAGDFWVAVTVPTQLTGVLQGHRISGNGTLLQKLTFSPHFSSLQISEVQEHNGKLYLGSLISLSLGVYNYTA